MHGPIVWQGSWLHMTPGMVDIVPVGLLWGYMTHRTGSFLPAAIAHGANIWGLQNL